jgi:hypothetical protein
MVFTHSFDFFSIHLHSPDRLQGQVAQETTGPALPHLPASVDEGQLPTRLSMLTTLNLTHPRRAEREFGRLVRALQGPLPHR